MTPAKTVKLLKALGVKVPSSQTRPGWTLSECPMGPWSHQGGKSSPEVFGVRNETGDPRANCFACGWHGTVGELLSEMRHRNSRTHSIEARWGDLYAMVDEAVQAGDLDLDQPGIEETLFGERVGKHEFPEWWLETFPPAWNVDWARAYLVARGVSEAVTLALDIRTDEKQRRVCFPVRDFKGVLYGLHGRAVDPAVDPRYRMYNQAQKNNPVLWLGENWIDRSLPIVVVEGPFDLASVYRVYRNVTSPLFCDPSVAKIKRMSDALEWITMYDKGTGGDHGRAKVSKVLGRSHVIHHLRPPKRRKDPGEMTTNELIESLSDIVQLTSKII